MSSHRPHRRCPCWYCTHLREGPAPRRTGVGVMALEAAVVTIGLIYLMLDRVPRIVAALLAG